MEASRKPTAALARHSLAAVDNDVGQLGMAGATDYRAAKKAEIGGDRSRGK